MKLEIQQVKSVVYPVRFDKKLFDRIKAIAKENKTSQGKVIRALIEKSLEKNSRL